MFASNQEFRISGSLNQLRDVIDIAMRLSGSINMFTRADSRVKVAFQKTPAGFYVIGRGSMHGRDDVKLDEGWTEYPFDYDPDIIAGILKQWLQSQGKMPSIYDGFDGSTEKAFLCRSVSCLKDYEKDDIKNLHAGIIVFAPYTNFYAK